MHSRGMTLVELLVVVAIIGGLVGLLLPAVQAARESARRMQCSNNLKQWVLALQSYHDVASCLPMGNITRRFWSWRAILLPHLEQDALYRLVDFSYQPDCFTAVRARFLISPELSPANKVLAFSSCPSDPNQNQVWSSDYYSGYSTSTYFGVAGTTTTSFDGVLFDGSRTRLAEITDGLSNTLCIGERGVPDDLFWGWCLCGAGSPEPGLLAIGTGDSVLNTITGFAPGDSKGAHNLHFWSYHPGGGQFALCDGSVRFFSYATEPKQFIALGTRGAGEPLGNVD
jgi:prepilin-type N-terminal cleavage/methylation domain-containing protein/prepilin-type processing-associated H-X9-DG protein